MLWLYIILAIVAVLCLGLLLRLRIRLQLDEENRLLFLGLGRSGSEIDFVAGVARIKLAGMTIKVVPLEVKIPARKAKEGKKPERPRSLARDMGTRLWRRTRAELRRFRRGVFETSSGSLPDLAAAMKNAAGALTGFLVGLIRDSRLEELSAHVEGGFASPNLTGQAYGYYCALAGALPSSAGRLVFVPHWTGTSFTGSARLAIVLPLYRLVYRVVRLVLQLPIKTIFRVVRLKREGGLDVK